jgi:hypothetical protein
VIGGFHDDLVATGSTHPLKKSVLVRSRQRFLRRQCAELIGNHPDLPIFLTLPLVGSNGVELGGSHGFVTGLKWAVSRIILRDGTLGKVHGTSVPAFRDDDPVIREEVLTEFRHVSAISSRDVRGIQCDEISRRATT